MNTTAAQPSADSLEEKLSSLDNVQQAMLNILEDFSAEKARLEDIQRANLNILEDFDNEEKKLQAVQRATLNILEDFNAEKIRSDDGHRALLNIMEDMDAEKAKVATGNQQLETVNKGLEAFSYSVSHDLRAPLRSLDGFSQALLEDYADKLDATGKDYLQRVRAAAQRMAELIDALLILSQVTRAEMRRERVDLTALARTIATELRQRDSGRQAEFIIPDGLVADGDPRLLRAALENLLSNAWKFTSQQPSARIELGAAPQPGEMPAYFVRDNGAGFDMAYANKLFGAFQRLHSQGEFKGTGIGLATVQRIIHRHGGRTWAEGTPNQGATFYFTLG